MRPGSRRCRWCWLCCALFWVCSVDICWAASQDPATVPGDPDEGGLAELVTDHYVEQAFVRYTDSMKAARELFKEIRALLAEPGEQTHAATKRAWIRAHRVYSHTEPFRFGNPNVDAWEGKVNAWPLDEGLIDYVAPSYVYHEGNPHALANIIGLRKEPITDDLIAEFSSGLDPKAAPVTNITDIETNVTTGYHAIEFLLWGQDLNEEPTSCGQRRYTDFLPGEEGTHPPTARRRDYLSAAGRLLMRDLRLMLADWQPDGRLYSQRFKELPVKERLDRMILGLGSMSFAELASERLRVALLAGGQEEEQSCFSDTTHLAILENARSIQSLYLGRHKCLDGKVVSGPSLSNLVARCDTELDNEMKTRLASSVALAESLAKAAEQEPFDQMILADNHAGNQRILELIAALRNQTETLEKIRARIPDLIKSAE